eukprot:1735713-Prymnesium_polylepis.1
MHVLDQDAHRASHKAKTAPRSVPLAAALLPAGGGQPPRAAAHLSHHGRRLQLRLQLGDALLELARVRLQLQHDALQLGDRLLPPPRQLAHQSGPLRRGVAAARAI